MTFIPGACYNPCAPQPGYGCYTNPCGIQYNNFPCNSNTTDPVAFIATAGVQTVPTGGGPVTVINGGIVGTTVPIDTVVVVGATGYTPIVNRGFVVNNGFVGVPSAGLYEIDVNVCFGGYNTTSSYTNGDVRVAYIYSVSSSGLVTPWATESRDAVYGVGTLTTPSTATCVTLSTVASLAAGDRIFVGVRQTTAAPPTDLTIASNANQLSRLAIVKIGGNNNNLFV